MVFVRASAAPQQTLQLWGKVQTTVHLLEKCLIDASVENLTEAKLPLLSLQLR